MKIWIAELMLIYNDENKWETIFDFELSDREYELDRDTNNYTYYKNWISERVPANIEVNRTWSGNLKVQQGFNRELNELELRELENKMKNLLLEVLEIEKNEYLQSYKNKVKSIRGEN